MAKRKPAPDYELDALAEQLLAELISDHPDDLEAVIEFLKSSAQSPDALKNLIKFKHTPVGVREFVESPDFMDRPGILWPAVLDVLEEICSGRYVESVLTGAIGVAKTTLALYIQAYQVYLLSCLRAPHKEFDLDPASEIVIIFQSLNKELAKEVDYGRFRSMMKEAPYFARNFAYDTGRESEMRFPNRIIVKPVAGHDKSAIGQNVIGGIIDEINFMAVTENSKNSRDGEVYDQAIKNYNTLAKRRESRFMNKGWLPGMLCLVSSRNYPGQFTDTKEAEAKHNPLIYVYDKRLWELRPERFGFYQGDRTRELIDTYGEDYDFWFEVFIGDATRKPRFIHPDEEVVPDDRPLVMQIPIEYRRSFEEDMFSALRDIAGVATQALHPFILDTEALSACFGRVKNLASRDDCDFVQSRIQLYPKRIVNREETRFCHIDLAISGDSAGFAVGHVSGFQRIDRGAHAEMMPIIQFDLLLEIRPPRGGEIEIEKTRRLLYAIRDLGLPVKWVTYDGFQSKDSMQILAQQGFTTGYQSMDVDTIAYDVTKQAIYDRRILFPTNPHAQSEFVRLERNPKTQKIDHPPKGSKDLTDAIAGVVYGLTMRREVWARHRVPLTSIPTHLIQAEATGKGTLTGKERKA